MYTRFRKEIRDLVDMLERPEEAAYVGDDYDEIAADLDEMEDDHYSTEEIPEE